MHTIITTTSMPARTDTATNTYTRWQAHLHFLAHEYTHTSLCISKHVDLGANKARTIASHDPNNMVTCTHT